LPESQRCGPQELAAVKFNHCFAPLGLARFLSLPHGLRRGLHYFAATRLDFLPSPRFAVDLAFAASRLIYLRDARPPSKFFFLQTLLLQSRSGNA
jgi:hypothetical protein